MGPNAKKLYGRVRTSLGAMRRAMATRLLRSQERRHEQRLLRDSVPHVLVLREARARHNDAFFQWLERTHREAARRFRHVPVWSETALRLEGTALAVSWLSDPVRERNPQLFARLRQIEAACDDAGVPFVNRPASLSNGIKSRALAILREAGLRTAHVAPVNANAPFDRIVDALGLPFIVRNDQQHCTPAHLIRSRGDFEQLDWPSIKTPIGLEFIDTQSADGFFRKYRYLLAGDTGITRHLVISQDWCTHAQNRMRGRRFLDEEQRAIEQPNPFHDALDRGRRALGLDYVAFDYGIDRTSRLIVWEPNPYPCLWGKFNARDPYFAYQREHIDRVFSLILNYCLRTFQEPLTQPQSTGLFQGKH